MCYGLNLNLLVDEQLISVLMQIYVAGTDTTSSVLYWAFLYLVIHPDIQDKLYAEIREQLGNASQSVPSNFTKDMCSTCAKILS